MLLGTPNAESSRLYGLTVTEGDPAWAGVLAGVSLELPVFHIVEPEIKSQVDPELYQEQVGLAEMVLTRGAYLRRFRQSGWGAASTGTSPQFFVLHSQIHRRGRGVPKVIIKNPSSAVSAVKNLGRLAYLS